MAIDGRPIIGPKCAANGTTNAGSASNAPTRTTSAGSPRPSSGRIASHCDTCTLMVRNTILRHPLLQPALQGSFHHPTIEVGGCTAKPQGSGLHARTSLVSCQGVATTHRPRRRDNSKRRFRGLRTLADGLTRIPTSTYSTFYRYTWAWAGSMGTGSATRRCDRPMPFGEFVVSVNPPCWSPSAPGTTDVPIPWPSRKP